jgi:site-specific DNA-methyltransferase (adenine-specific)
MSDIITTKFDDGYVLFADSTSSDTWQIVEGLVGQLPLIIADPPYGNIVKEKWDKTNMSDDDFAEWMRLWTELWTNSLLPGGAFYVWGGIGKPNFRPFFKYIPLVESHSKLELANLITWSKKRAVGHNNNYLFTREECAYFINGSMKKPRTFNVSLLDELRGYAGYDPAHPAKSEYYRRTNVWRDITEIFRGKIHPTQKAQRLHEVIIEVHTNIGDWVLDPFAGCGTTAMAARKLGRKFIVIENEQKMFDLICSRLDGTHKPQKSTRVHHT